ncbi:MAG: hydantoinase B/oxoprolinase family protein [Deltaproteobacteria bacterium]|nr:hydantoinase B/oxoprolinase family protein [Deltaproteobacteria bacterium]
MEKRFDPILVEVMKNELAIITEEMALAVWKTGRSTMVKTGDFATSICDSQGRLVGPGYSSAFQLASFMEMMPHLLKKWPGTLRPGDVILVNDPYVGVNHMPDVTLVAPVFWRGELAAFNIVYSHHTDIGGRFPGGISTQCTESFEEGVRIPLVKLCEAGKRNEALVECILANVRVPEDWLGDLEAKLAGCWRGEQEVQALLDKYGPETFMSCCNYLMEYAEQASRAAIRAIPDGRYVCDGILEDDGFSSEGVALKLKVALQVAGDTLTVDFTGTEPQVKSAINMPFSMGKAMVYSAIKGLVSPEVPMNVGFTRPMHVIAPLGSLVNPRFPAAVGGRAPLGLRVFDMVCRALAQALPDQVPVPGEGGDILHLTGQRADGRPFGVMDIVFGGWGGRPHKDGIDGVAPVNFASYGTVSTELIEREYPIVVEGFGYVPDTAGAGKYRGSLAIYKQWRFLEPGKFMVRTMRPLQPSEGLAGGRPAVPAKNIFNPGTQDLELPRITHHHFEVQPGDRIYHMVSGSGGHGDPWERAPEKVLADVRDEKVTITAAREQYGVAIEPQSLSIDWEQTRVLRQRRQGPERLVAAD